MSSDNPPDPLAGIVEDALSLLDRDKAWEGKLETPLPSLLQQSRTLVEQSTALDDEPVRMLHHFACTGGTLISRCVAALPNIFMISELDPLSPLGLGGERPAFAPTDLIRHLRYSLRPVPDTVIEEVFCAAYRVMQERLAQRGFRVVVRDHTHSHYCTGPQIPTRTSLRALLERDHRVLSFVTVRNPLESFISMVKLVQSHERFSPWNFDEYCRRYLVFLDDYADVPCLRYEDFVADPATHLRQISEALQLPWNEQALDLIAIIRLTGDSGRRGDNITARPPKSLPGDLVEEARQSRHFPPLMSRLGYDLPEFEKFDGAS